MSEDMQDASEPAENDIVVRLYKAATKAGVLLCDPPKPSEEMALLMEAASTIMNLQARVTMAERGRGTAEAEIASMKRLLPKLRRDHANNNVEVAAVCVKFFLEEQAPADALARDMADQAADAARRATEMEL